MQAKIWSSHASLTTPNAPDNVQISVVKMNSPVSARVSEAFGKWVSVNFQPCNLKKQNKTLIISWNFVIMKSKITHYAI